MAIPTCALFALGVLVACEHLLDVESPVRVPASALNDPARAALLVQGAVADFECAFPNYVGGSGMITDELISSTDLPNITGWDRRVVLPNNAGFATGPCDQYGAPSSYGLYTPLATARFQADDVYLRIEAFPAESIPGNEPAKDSLLATAAAYAGYSYTIFGEGFCTAAFDGGPELTADVVLRIAEARFTTALDLARRAGDSTVLNMARVGRARVRVDLASKDDSAGNGALAAQKRAEAALDARDVPFGFVHYAGRASGNKRLENVVYWHNRGFGVVSVDFLFRNLEVGGVPDPRVLVVFAGRLGNDGRTELWYQTKYLAPESPIPLASWDEAQLIIAEAEGGQSAVDRINDLRDNVGLPAFSSTDPVVIRQQVIEERRRELFLEGHRLSDMLRFRIPFQTGPYHKGDTYGTTECLPLPNVERDNNDSIP